MCLVIYYLVSAKSFNERRKILPVVFFGNSVKNSKLRGTLYFAKCSAQCFYLLLLHTHELPRRSLHLAFQLQQPLLHQDV
jgi:hypothetical protein